MDKWLAAGFNLELAHRLREHEDRLRAIGVYDFFTSVVAWPFTTKRDCRVIKGIITSNSGAEKMNINTLTRTVMNWYSAHPEIKPDTLKIAINPDDIEALRIEQGLDELPSSLGGFPLTIAPRLKQGKVALAANVWGINTTDMNSPALMRGIWIIDVIEDTP